MLGAGRAVAKSRAAKEGLLLEHQISEDKWPDGKHVPEVRHTVTASFNKNFFFFKSINLHQSLFKDFSTLDPCSRLHSVGKRLRLLYI